jgi:hypothetical protein
VSSLFSPPATKQVKAAIQPGAPKPTLVKPAGQPVPVLQELGYHGGIADFNTALQAVVDQHQKTFGYQPKPDVALHAVVNTPPAELPNLFSPAARQPMVAQALAAHPLVTDQQFVNEMRQQAASPNWQVWLHENAERVNDLNHDKRWAPVVHGIVLKASGQPTSPEPPRTEFFNPRDKQELKLYAASFGTPLGFLAHAVGQIADSLVHAPAGLYQAGKAVHEDLAAADPTNPRHLGQSDLSFTRTKAIGKATGQGFAQDIRHPYENAGYLFLDLLGLASLGAGTAARVSEVARTGEAGALLRKPPLQRATVGVGSYTEQMPLSSNPFVAAVQKRVLGSREAAANERLVDGPSPLRPAMLPEWAEKHFSFERKIGRETDARLRIEHTAAMQLTHELEAAAGTALAQSRVLGRLPVTTRNGLTRGEQKAIQVLSWDDPKPLEAERDFHRRMIEMGIGDHKAHERQLADLTLAEKALENPRPRFQQALDLTRQVIAENERIKIEELGLAPETAEGRIAKAADVLRGETPEPGGKPEYGGFYLPTQPRGKVKQPPSQVRGRFSVSAGPYGVPVGREMPELTHEFTGDALRAGDFRIDATNLASEAYARTVRAATVKNQWNKLWEAASPTKRSEWDIPIRDANEIPDELRTVIAKLDEGYFTQAEADLLPEDMRDLIRALYPDEKRLAPDEIKGVRWIDQRLLGDQLGPVHIPGLGARAAQFVNAPFRFTALYLRPAYILNKLGNQAILIFDQGFLNSGVNIARAMTLKQTDGAVNAAMIRKLVGAGKSRSYVTSSTGRFSRGVAEFWNRIADRDERVASFLYYADRKGYKTPEDRNRLLTDEASKADLVEITRRSNKALVEFENLLPVEKNYLRHLIFVYPWVSRSAVWSLRAIMEHPAKTALLAEFGKQELENDPLLDKAPDWFKRIGYIPVGWNHDGTPKVVNPTSVNTFSTLEEFLSIGKGATVGDKYATASDLFGPAAQYFAHATLGRDEYGNQYPDSQWLGAAREVLGGLPQLTHLKKRTNEPVKPFDIRHRDSLEASLNSYLHQTVFTPGWLDGYGSLIAGGLSPRGVNTKALSARYWADQDPKVRARRELDLLNRALTMQGEFLKRDVPPSIRASVKERARISQLYGEFAKEHGRTATEAEKQQIEKKYLAAHNRTPAQAKEAAKELRQWDADVRLLYSFKKDTFNEKAGRLFKQGLSPQARYNVPQERLYEYGREFVKWQQGVREAKAKGATAADLRLLTDEHSKPVKGLPSFAAISWSHLTPEEQQHELNRNLGAGWDTLTAVDKKLLGKPVDPAVTEAWTAYDKLTSPEALAKQLPAGERSLDKDQRLAVVKQIDRYYNLGGKFLQDYLFSKQPLYQRLGYLNAVKDSPHRSDWQELFQRANDLATAVANKQTTSTVARDAWRDYTAQLVDYYRTERPAFWKELQPILKADPEFLRKLIS